MEAGTVGMADKVDRVAWGGTALRVVYQAPGREAGSRSDGLGRSLPVQHPGVYNDNWDISYTILILLRNLDEIHPMTTICGQEYKCYHA